MPHVVVSYDVVSDRRRARVARMLKGFVARVQKSVFEGEVSESRLEELRGRLMKEIDPGEDSVRIYFLCARCEPGAEHLGATVELEEPADWIA
jgi:CRISPR-associated protein Cas2